MIKSKSLKQIEEKLKYNNKKMSNKARGTATLKRAFAASNFLKVPPYSG